MSDLAVNNYEIINDFLTLKWTNGDESYIPLKKLRENCPCATCSGETDALGNLHKGLQPALNPVSYQLLNLRPVGYYALQPFWGDGHNTGIYRFELLRKLEDSDSEDQ